MSCYRETTKGKLFCAEDGKKKIKKNSPHQELHVFLIHSCSVSIMQDRSIKRKKKAYLFHIEQFSSDVLAELLKPYTNGGWDIRSDSQKGNVLCTI